MTQPTPRLKLPPRAQGWSHTVRLLLGVLMFGGILVALAVYTAPDLVTDWQVRDAARPSPRGRVVEGSCRSNLMLDICDATLEAPTPAGPVTRSVNIIFVGMHRGDYTVTVMADPARPELATTDMALEKLWNRTLTLLAAAMLLLVMTILPIVAILRRARTRPGRT